jgi:STE24 endopeptidase
MAFNAQAETARYIDSLGADQLEKAAAYTAGNHWHLLWGLLVSALVTWLIVRSGILDRLSERLRQRGLALRAFVIGGTFLVAAALISLPWTIYEEWWREKSYGRTSQPLGDFLFQNGLGILISGLVGGLFLIGLYWLMRKTGRRWWLWSGGLTAAALAFILLLSPVLIEPLFNKYQPVPEGPVKTALIEMADRAGIPPEKIFMYDGSRQSNNFTANVSGVLGSARIAISDVAMKQASLAEVRAVTGHEIGHYVLGHVWLGIIVFSLLAALLFFLADRLFPRFARLFGSDARVDEPRGIPVLGFIVGLFALLAMPITNTLSRFDEGQADDYSLRTVNEPDALAGALVKTAEYRYPRPHPVQEFIFYTHPSVERRVRNAMEWKASHPPSR